MGAFPNPIRALTDRWKSKEKPSKIVPFRRSDTALPIQQDGEQLTPHQFLEAQIVNLPDEEESAQKRLLFTIAYFLATWGGSVIMIVLGFGLANDMQTIFHITGSYALVSSAIDYWSTISKTGVTDSAYLASPVATHVLNYGPHQL